MGQFWSGDEWEGREGKRRDQGERRNGMQRIQYLLARFVFNIEFDFKPVSLASFPFSSPRFVSEFLQPRAQVRSRENPTLRRMMIRMWVRKKETE